ncbi:MBL fold metallo-hydrolase [bacterium]|nr:MBL fold metallo-hydrolase [bacterium]
MDLTFCGAAKIVTGSCYWIKTGKTQILVDCGMFQGSKKTNRRNYEPFKFKPEKIDYLFLTHAHIDHSGLIPKLVANGFSGKIFTTDATIDLCEIMLEDSAGIQIMETEHENKRRLRQGLPPRKPLYTIEDAKNSMQFFEAVEYDRLYNINDTIEVRYRDAGHILGSSIIELFVKENGQKKKLVFSGDIGQWNVPIVKDPTMIDEADYLFVESTYGDRLHEGVGLRNELLLKYTVETFKKGGKLLIPSFAIERTQELLYSFNDLILSGSFPDEKIFLDSPLAIKATEIFKKYRKYYDKEAKNEYEHPFTFPNLVYNHETEDSIKLNNYGKPCIIIAGSGMCTGGRIRHHLKHSLWDPKNTVLFVGYQAEGSLGRYILEGAERVKMMGLEIIVKADIRKINSFSAHADYPELIKWTQSFTEKPETVFVVHGEEKSAMALSDKLKELGFDCHVPEIGEVFTIGES